MAKVENILKSALEQLFNAKNAQDIKKALNFFREFFDAIGVPEFEGGKWVTTNFGKIYIEGNTQYAYNPPSIDTINKRWLSREYGNLTIAMSYIFQVIKSVMYYIPELRDIEVRVPVLEVRGRTLETPIEELPKDYFKLLKLSEEQEDIKIDRIYVHTEINTPDGRRWFHFFGLPKVTFKPRETVINFETCDNEEDFYFEPEV